jgi:hypothetical protein
MLPNLTHECVPNVLKLSSNVNECKPLAAGQRVRVGGAARVRGRAPRGAGRHPRARRRVHPRQGLTLVHFQLNLSRFGHRVSPCVIDWGKIMHPTHHTTCPYIEPKSGRVSAPDLRRPVPAGRAQKRIGAACAGRGGPVAVLRVGSLQTLVS